MSPPITPPITPLELEETPAVGVSWFVVPLVLVVLPSSVAAPLVVVINSVGASSGSVGSNHMMIRICIQVSIEKQKILIWGATQDNVAAHLYLR